MKPEVFVSYSRKDWGLVIPIVQRLREAGTSVWVDQGDIDGAVLWAEEIVEAIENCKVMILMASNGSFASRNVVKELALASENNKSILPILLEPVEIPKTMKYQLAGVQYIEFFRGNLTDNMQAVVRSLNRLGVFVEELIENPEPPSVLVTSPHNDERLIAGGRCLVQWTAQATSGREIIRYRVELCRGTKVLSTIAGEKENLSDNFYLWDIPPDLNLGDEYKVKVTVWDDKGESGVAFSNGNFVIQRPVERPLKVEQEIVNRLTTIDILSPLTAAEVAQLASASITETFLPGESVVRGGQSGESMFIVHKGEIAAQILHSDGEAIILSLAMEGDTFGEYSLLHGGERSVSYVAREQSEVIVIGFQAMRSLFQANPSLIDGICDVLVNRKAHSYHPYHREVGAEELARESKEASIMAKRHFNLGLTTEMVEEVEWEAEPPKPTTKPWWKFW
jgi:CRP-like cAMP-binding protein